MNIINTLASLLQPARAARLDAARAIAFIAGTETAPLGRLLTQVENAERATGLALGGAHARALRQHLNGTASLRADQIVDTVTALKRDNQATLHGLMRNSAGTQSGSAHAQQIRQTRQLCEMARNFAFDVARQPKSQHLAVALRTVGNSAEAGQGTSR